MKLFLFKITDNKKTYNIEVVAISYEAAYYGLGPMDGCSVAEEPLSEFSRAFKMAMLPKKIPQKDLAAIFKGIARCCKSGVSLPNAISINASLVKSPVLKGLLGELYILTGKKGYGFSEALNRFPEHFNNMIIALVKAGEKTGNLEAVLLEISQRMEKNESIFKNLKAGFYYPAFILCITVLAFFVIVYFVMPQMKRNFESFNVELPGITQFYLGFSDYLHTNYLFIPSAILLLYLSFRFGSYVFKTIAFQRLLLKLPIIGKLLHSVILVRSLQALAMLSKSGTDILSAYEITKEVAGNIVYREYFDAIYQRLKKGEQQEMAFFKEKDRIGENGFILACQIKLSAFGGETHLFLNEIVQTLSEEVETKTRELPKLIQPILMMVIAAAVGSIIAAVYLPTFSLLQGVLQ